MSENNKNQYDLEWEKLREEYKNIVKKEPTIKIEENNIVVEEELEQVVEKVNTDDFHKDLEDLKLDKDFVPKNKEEEHKNGKGLSNIRRNVGRVFVKLVNGTDSVLEKISKKQDKVFWTEDNRKELSTMITIFLIILLFLIAILGLMKIPEIRNHIFIFSDKYDTIESEDIVYVDEDNGFFHNADCIHIKKGMRYLVLEERYAIQLGYKPCSLYEK